jgi:hypothetical protein
MNQRIRELVVKAGIYDCEPSDPLLEVAEEYVMLTQLAVLECAGVDLYWLSEQDRKAVAEKIKEHFGIKDE